MPDPDADVQVEAVLDVLAPKSEAVWFTDQNPAERVRVPIISLDYQGIPVSPNHDQLLGLARAIVTAIRTASGPAAALTAGQAAAVLPVLRGEYSAQHDEATEEACLALAAVIGGAQPVEH